MNFDDEKDSLEFFEDPQDDSISLDGFLDTDADGIVSIKDGSSAQNTDIPVAVFSNKKEEADIGELSDLIGDSDLQTDSDYSADDVDEDEIRRILTSDNSNVDVSPQNDIEPQEHDDAEVEDEQDDITLKTEEKPKKQGVSPVLIALLFAVIAAGAAYLLFTNVANRDDASNESQVLMPQDQNQLPPQDQPQPADEQLAQNDQGIPVVNEEDASTLKADENEEENQPEEKKEVVAVIPTGRANPFMPLQKYAPKTEVITKTINNIDYDSIKIPKPPKTYGEVNDYTDKLMTISVSGIMYDKTKPSAIITYESNDYFVQIGDKLDKFKVIEIGPTFVRIALGKNTYEAKIGEEFKISSDFYGNIPYNNGSRQYYSSEDEYRNGVEGNKGHGYVNKSEVRIIPSKN